MSTAIVSKIIAVLTVFKKACGASVCNNIYYAIASGIEPGVDRKDLGPVPGSGGRVGNPQPNIKNTLAFMGIFYRTVALAILFIAPFAKGAYAFAAEGGWQDRAAKFAALNLDLSGSMVLKQLDHARPLLDERKQDTLKQLFDAEIRYQNNPPESGIDEDENDYFLDLTAAAGLYGDERFVPLLFDESVVTTGTLAYAAAARTGDNGLPLLAEKMRDREGEFYADYHGVACLMQQHHLVKKTENAQKLESLLMDAVNTENDLYRSFGATCLKWLPAEKARPVLMQLATNDPSLRVRENASDALKALAAD